MIIIRNWVPYARSPIRPQCQHPNAMKTLRFVELPSAWTKAKAAISDQGGKTP